MADKEYNAAYYKARRKELADKARRNYYRYKAEHPERHKEVQERARVKYKYGITLEEYRDLMRKPCAICGDTAVHLDHDHKTGKVREALCRRHNTALGRFNDNADELERAAMYLRKHES